MSIAQHFVALTTNVAAAQAFGITRCLEFPDWVGGAFRCGRPLACRLPLPIGQEQFRDLLARAHAMDAHFFNAPIGHNLPLRLALLDIWYAIFATWAAAALPPTAMACGRLAAYLQQLEMESNGKRVTHARPVPEHARLYRLGRAGHKWPARLFSCCRGRMWSP